MNKEKETSECTSPAIVADTVLATGLYCIKVKASFDCWIANWEGDPGRTLIKENAKIFKSKINAEKLCNHLKSEYPSRDFSVAVF